MTILDGLINNAGSRFLRDFADEPLLERLRIAATDPMSDPDVKAKCKQLFGQWAVSFKETRGMERVVALNRQLPQRKKAPSQHQSKVLRETATPAEAPAETPASPRDPLGFSVSVSGGDGPSRTLTDHKAKRKSQPVPIAPASSLPGTEQSSSKKSRQRAKTFSLDKEKPAMLQCIASSSVASTNLTNALKLVNREAQRVSEVPEVAKRFEVCKQLRRQVLRYIQHVESEDFLGSLLQVNEELVNALMSYEVLDKSVENDSDSDDGDYIPPHLRAEDRQAAEALAKMDLNAPPKPPRPTSIQLPTSPPPVAHGKAPAPPSESDTESEPEEEDDADNPFGDSNAVATPARERPGMTWYVCDEGVAECPS